MCERIVTVCICVHFSQHHRARCFFLCTSFSVTSDVAFLEKQRLPAKLAGHLFLHSEDLNQIFTVTAFDRNCRELNFCPSKS
jgi:hypothetical protein